jgi:cobalamin biosynthesis Mg chelatase CobN
MNCSAEDVLNHGDLAELRKLYQEYQQAEKDKQELNEMVEKLLNQVQVPPKP